MGRAGKILALLFLVASCAGRVAVAAPTDATTVYDASLRVCADPDEMPYSNGAGQGFENKLAEMLANDLGTTVAYSWYPTGAPVTQLLTSGECDVLMGVPALEGIETSRSYYRSGYVFVSRADRNITFSSMSDPRLRQLRIGVTLVGADGAGTPPAIALGRQGIVNNVRGFPAYGDGEGPADPILSVADGDIDIAAVWGPIAGYYAKSASVALRITPITDTDAYLPQTFEFPIAIGFKSGDRDLRDRLNAFVARHKEDIRRLLQDYGVPLL